MGRIYSAAHNIVIEISRSISININEFKNASTDNRLRLIFYTPSSPGKRAKDKFFDVGKKHYQIGVAATGGRYFGFGIRTKLATKNNLGHHHQLFRIDYHDHKTFRDFQLHYHVEDGPDNNI